MISRNFTRLLIGVFFVLLASAFAVRAWVHSPVQALLLGYCMGIAAMGAGAAIGVKEGWIHGRR